MEAPNLSLLFKLSLVAIGGDVHIKEGKLPSTTSTTVRGKMSGHTRAAILGDVAKMVTDPGSKGLAGFSDVSYVASRTLNNVNHPCSLARDVLDDWVRVVGRVV